MSVLRIYGVFADETTGSTGSATVWRIREDTVDLITAAHVIKNVKTLFVTAPEMRGTLLPATALGASVTSDVAVIRMRVPAIADVTPGSTAEQVRELVNSLEELRPPASGVLLKGDGVVLGFPLNLPMQVQTRGTVGFQEFNNRLLYQMSQDLNPGNSGGALFDEAGAWWGVPFAGLNAGKDISFIVTAFEALAVAEKILGAYNGSFVNVSPVYIDAAGPPPVGSTLTVDRFTLRVVESPLPGVWATAGPGTPKVRLDLWVSFIPEGTYTFQTPAGGQVRVGVYRNVNEPVRRMMPGYEVPGWVVIGEMHVAELAVDHLDHFGITAPVARNEPRLIVVDAPAGTEAAAHVGSLLVTVDGHPVRTVDDVEAIGTPEIVETTRGPWVFRTGEQNA